MGQNGLVQKTMEQVFCNRVEWFGTQWNEYSRTEWNGVEQNGMSVLELEWNGMVWNRVE